MTQLVSRLSNKKTTKVIASAFVLALAVSSVALTQATFGPNPNCNENASLSLVGSLPATLTPGQQVAFQVKVVNNGETWFYHGNYFKLVQKSSLNLNPTYGHISPSMRPGDEQIEDFVLTAPATAGSYTLSLQMQHGAGVEYLLPTEEECNSIPANDVLFGNNLTHTFTVASDPTPNPTPSPTPNPNPGPEMCSSNAPQKLVGEIINDGATTGVATARVTNNSTFCAYPIGFASYKMFMMENPHGTDPSWLTTQELYDSVTTNIGPGQTIDVNLLAIEVPNCRSQIDLFEGTVQTPPWYGFSQGHHLMDFAWVDKAVCVNTPPPPPPVNPPPPPAPTPTINLEKVVRNVSANQATFVESTAANFGDQVEFQLSITATHTVTNIKISDVLPDRLVYVNNSLRFEGADAGNDLNNIVIGTLDGVTKKVTLRATVKDASNFSEGTTTLTNTANLTSSAGNDSDTANVTVQKSVTPPPPPPPPVNPPPPPPPSGGGSSAKLTIEKTVRNVTVAPNSNFVETVEARKDEQVEFKIVVTSTRSTRARDVRVQDILPKNPTLTYVSGSLKIDGVNSSKDLFGDWISLGNLARNESRTLTFKARVPTVTSNTTVTNVAKATADNASRVEDNAKVKLIPVQGGSVNLNLSKRAYNNTKSKDATTITAKAGDSITYTLRVQNTGTVDATGFIFEDNIADILQLSDLTNFSGADYNATTKMVTWPAVTIPAGSTVEKSFTVKVKSPIPTGTDYVMTNVFGNEVRVPVDRGFVAPNTGAASTMSFGLAFLSLISFAGYRMYLGRQQLV